MKSLTKRKVRKRQSLERSVQGKERKLKPVPVVENLKKAFRLAGKVAIITGADSGIGKAVALMYAKEGADLVLTYYKDRKDARETSQRVKELGARHILLQGDVSDEKHCKRIVKAAIDAYKKLDIVINNAAVQYPQDKLANIGKRQIQRTFETEDDTSAF
jgi:NAD(P)-dependent dehydrogenase (short-subunit alcohol dehydrogenase family)